MKTLKLICFAGFILVHFMGCLENIEKPVPVTESIKAVAGEDQEVLVNTEVLLTGLAEGATEPILFSWTFKTKPEGSGSELDGANQASAKFTPDLVGNYFIEFTASKLGKSHTDEIKVAVLSSPTEILKAIAGEDREVFVNSEITMSGTAEGPEPIDFEWTFKTQPTGSNAQIMDEDKAVAKFKPLVVGEYILELKVSKGKRNHTDQVKITAKAQEKASIIIDQDINKDSVLEDIFEDGAIADYIVTSNVKLNAKLTVKPGVAIHFEEDKSLTVSNNGAILAKGTPQERIFFTGKEPVKGYWKGILIDSNNPLNEFAHVLVSFGGGSTFMEAPDIKANIILNGSDYSTSILKISSSTITESGGYGLYMKGMAELGGFEGNNFSNNQNAAAFIPARQLQFLDFHSNLKGENGFDGVETGGLVNNQSIVEWKGFNDGSKYLVSQDLIIRSGLKIMAGAGFEMKMDKMIEVSDDGYLNAMGSEAMPITFKSHSKTQEVHWKGILFHSSSLFNNLLFTEVAYAGSSLLPEMDKPANVAVSNGGKLTARNSKFHDGKGYGVVTAQKDRVNADIMTSNSFFNFVLGNAYPESLTNPEPPDLASDWVDWWSFNEELYIVDEKFFVKSSEIWFKGALGPWSMSDQQGFGIRISENGNFIWTVAERHTFAPECNSYSAEYILGSIQVVGNQIKFEQNYWRTKFTNSCDTSQNSDENVTPVIIVLNYEINRVFHHLTGMPFWELKFINPDGSTFSYFRK